VFDRAVMTCGTLIRTSALDYSRLPLLPNILAHGAGLPRMSTDQSVLALGLSSLGAL
jgi:hypothetical protein